MKPEEMAELRELLHEQVHGGHTMALAACQGKQKFDTRSDAIRSIRPEKRGFVDAYRCPVCHHWHAGSKKQARYKRLAEERAKCA